MEREINHTVDDAHLCKLAEIFLSGITQTALGERFGVSQETIGYRLRCIFIRISQSEGVKLSRPIKMRDIINVSDVWLAALRGYQARLKRVAA